MLVHICCSVDSHYFIQRLAEDFPDRKITAYFYNPNIHPYSEYQLRLLDVQRSCDMLSIELIDGEYDLDGWFDATKGYEDAPEKGARCSICFDTRFEATAKLAQRLGIKEYTSTLLTSPKKSIEQLTTTGVEIANRYDLEFVSVDYRKDGGTQKQFALAKEDRLYHQNFCGCVYALQKQREAQERVADELFCAINRQILPQSIEEQLELYKLRLEYEKESIAYKIAREDFLNYRLLRGLVKHQKESIDSYIFSYSILKRKKSVVKIDETIDGVHYLNRDNIKFIDIEKLNQIAKKSYSNIKELLNNPLTIEEEMAIREKINISFFSLSPIIVLEKAYEGKYELFIDAIIYQDVKEVLLKL
jgi:predicted adenine nucleotide alpha hydrolase (AANH) superfamily ATPase